MSIMGGVRIPLQRAFKKILEEIGYPDTQIVFSHQNGLEPDKSYGVINILQVNQLGGRNEASFIEPTSDILEFITHHSITIQISFVGTEAANVGYDFRQAMVNNRRCFEILQLANFGITSRGDVRRIPQKRETAWVEAYNMDIDFTFAVFTRQSYDWVEYIDVNGERFHIWTRG